MSGRFTILLTVVGLTAAACSGGDPLQGYFEDVSEVTTELAATVETLPRASTDGPLSDARAYFSGIDEALGDAQASLEGLSPPEEMIATHEGFVATVSAFADIASGAAIRGESLESRDELMAMANDDQIGVAAFREARKAVLDACALLLVTASHPEIGVEVNCSAFAAGDGRSAASAIGPSSTSAAAATTP